jgi:hypothetical protein
MKKLIYTVIILSTIILTTTNCSDEKTAIKSDTIDMYNKTAYENKTQEEKEAYCKFHLLQIASYLDIEFKNSALNQEIASKGTFDGVCKTMYIKDMLNNFQNKANSIEKNTNFELIQKSLDAFENLENENWQVTFSIPNYQNVSTNKELDESKPIFILSVDTEKEINAIDVDGYQKNEQDAMEKLDTKVNEQTTIDHTVYRLGIQIMPIRYGDDGEGGGGGGGTTGGGSTDWDLGGLNGTGAGTIVTPGSSEPAASTPGLTIKKMICREKKESSFEKNDVKIAGFKEVLNPQYSGNCGESMASSSNCYNGGDGKIINHFTNSNVNNQEEVFVNFKIENLVSSNIYPVIFYVIYEYDNAPAPLRTKTFIFPNGTTRNINYRSWESNPYDSPMLYLDANSTGNNPSPYPIANNYVYNDWDMKYTLKYSY